MLKRKGVKEAVDTMRLPAVVRFSWSFWGDARNGATAKELKFVMRLVCRFLALPDTHTCANTSCCNVYSCIICSLSGLFSAISIQLCSLYRIIEPNYLHLRNTPGYSSYAMNPHDRGSQGWRTLISEAILISEQPGLE
jgi:hypothetical protein